MKVSIFSTCVMDLMFPQVGIAIVEVLRTFGELKQTYLNNKFVVDNL